MKQIIDALNNFKDDAENRIGTIEEKLDERMAMHIEDYFNNLLDDVEGCESPIEKIFVLELRRAMESSRANFVGDLFEWESQGEIVVFEGFKREKKYRADFLVNFLRQENDIHYRFVIECDGHDFHEKTKEQVARDKRRDRDMMESGIVVIRFTGSEIYENPYRCAYQAVNIIENQLKQYRM